MLINTWKAHAWYIIYYIEYRKSRKNLNVSYTLLKLTHFFAAGAAVEPELLTEMTANTKNAAKTKETLHQYKAYIQEDEAPLTHEESLDLRLGMMAATSHLGVYAPG